MMNRFGTFWCLLYIFYCRTTAIFKTLGQFENLVFVIMSTRENIRLFARTPFQIVFFLIFSNICCRYTLKLPLCTPTYVFSINEFFIISFFQPLSIIQRNEHVEMINFSCSLSCTWMIIKDCLFYPSGSLS